MPSRRRARTIGVDLEHPAWSEALLNAVYEAHKPSVWPMEGLLLYITEPAARTLLGTASALTVPRSWLGMDLVNEDPLTSPTMQPLLAAFARRGAPAYLGVNDPEAPLAECVWKSEVTQPSEQGKLWVLNQRPGYLCLSPNSSSTVSSRVR